MEVSTKNKQPAQGVYHSSSAQPSSHWLVCSLLLHVTFFLPSHLDCLCWYLPTFLFCLLSSPSSCLDTYYLSKTRSSHVFLPILLLDPRKQGFHKGPHCLECISKNMSRYPCSGPQWWRSTMKAVLYGWRIRMHQNLCSPWSPFSPSRSSQTLLYP